MYMGSIYYFLFVCLINFIPYQKRICNRSSYVNFNFSTEKQSGTADSLKIINFHFSLYITITIITPYYTCISWARQNYFRVWWKGDGLQNIMEGLEVMLGKKTQGWFWEYKADKFEK